MTNRTGSLLMIELNLLLIIILMAGADPGRNLTRGQAKARGRGYIGVALSVGIDKRYSLESSNSSVEWPTSLRKSKQLKTEIVLGGSANQRNSQMQGSRMQSKH